MEFCHSIFKGISWRALNGRLKLPCWVCVHKGSFGFSIMPAWRVCWSLQNLGNSRTPPWSNLGFLGTGKSLSETLIFASNNPQYDDRLFIELQVQYQKIPSSNLGRACCVQKLFLTFRTIFVHNMFSPCSELGIFMYWTCNSMNNLSSYCGLVDAK